MQRHSIRVRLPSPHPSQDVFVYWNDWHPKAQVLVGPCGTKAGKSFGSAIWLSREAMLYSGLYCLWIGPTIEKAKIGYRYVKAMMPESMAQCSDAKLEIRLANNTFVKFTHGRDAEVTVEGESVHRFVMDEAGKQRRQLWYSLLTTITQTLGLGIITGTPRGLNWYSEVYRQAISGDPFFCHAQLPTSTSPYVSPQAIENAKRILPTSLFNQYYLAQFVSESNVFGDLGEIWFRDPPVRTNTKLWIHPDLAQRSVDTVTGVDVAKKRDYTVFLTTNTNGIVVGYWRFRGMAYTEQAHALVKYLSKFPGDKHVRYDATGVGEGFGDILNEVADNVDAVFIPVLFTNLAKQDMVTRTRIAIESDWWKCPYIEQIEHEFAAYEMRVSRTGLHTFAAVEGENDDCVSAGMLSISGAFQSAKADYAVEVLEKLNTGNRKKDSDGEYQTEDNDEISQWANAVGNDFDEIENCDGLGGDEADDIDEESIFGDLQD